MGKNGKLKIWLGAFLSLLGLLVWRVAYAEGESAPSWVKALPSPDAFYHYYVGRGSSRESERDAFAEASLNAQEQALKENFGVETQVRNQSYETQKEGILTKNITEYSEKVKLQGFEQVEFFREAEEGATKVWILFRYKNSEIEKERTRLKSKKADEPVTFHEEGSDHSAKGGLRIVTFPSGASVFIDGTMVPFQKTPYTMYGQLEPGPHEIKLDHPNYEIETRTFIFEVGKVTEVQVQLKKAIGVLKITSEPEGAKISINGKAFGKTPSNKIKVRVGEPTYVELSHPEAERIAKEISVVREQVTEEHFEMTPKPSYFQVSSNPDGATVFLKGRKTYTGTTPTPLIPCEAGRYTIEISKSGFQTKTDEVLIRGGQRQVLPTYKLEPEVTELKKEEPKDNKEDHKNSGFSGTHPYQSAVFGLSFIGMASTFNKLDQPGYGGSVSLELKLGNHVGLFGEFIYKASSAVKYKNGEVSSTASGYRVGLPLYGNTEKGSAFFLSPEVIGMSTSLKLERTTSGTQNISASQTGFGASIGILGLNPDTKSGSFYRLSVHGFGDGGGYTGSTTFSFGLGVIFGQ